MTGHAAPPPVSLWQCCYQSFPFDLQTYPTQKKVRASGDNTVVRRTGVREEPPVWENTASATLRDEVGSGSRPRRRTAQASGRTSTGRPMVGGSSGLVPRVRGVWADQWRVVVVAVAGEEGGPSSAGPCAAGRRHGEAAGEEGGAAGVQGGVEEEDRGHAHQHGRGAS